MAKSSIRSSAVAASLFDLGAVKVKVAKKVKIEKTQPKAPVTTSTPTQESLSEKSHSAASLQNSVKGSVFSPQVGSTTIVEKNSPFHSNPQSFAEKGTSRTGSKTGFTDSADLLNRYRNIEQNKYVTQEFQSFGCHIAEALDDKAHTSLYIKLAKQIQRGLLERALSFVSDANADNKAKLFMWKLNQLKQESLAQIKKS